MNKQIIQFLRNECENKDGDTISHLYDMTNEELERDHTWIQYCFPLPEVSKFNPDAPLLDEETAFAISTDFKAQLGLYSAFIRVLHLYGLQTSEVDYGYTGRLYVGWEACPIEENEVTNWLAPFDHNHLRITRVLTCLRMCGLKEYTEAFLVFLNNQFNLGYFSISSMDYWKNAVYPDLFPQKEKINLQNEEGFDVDEDGKIVDSDHNMWLKQDLNLGED